MSDVDKFKSEPIEGLLHTILSQLDKTVGDSLFEINSIDKFPKLFSKVLERHAKTVKVEVEAYINRMKAEVEAAIPIRTIFGIPINDLTDAQVETFLKGKIEEDVNARVSKIKTDSVLVAPVERKRSKASTTSETE
jgi:hypothetical protein